MSWLGPATTTEPFPQPYHHRLVPGSVARSGDHEHAGHGPGLAIQHFVAQPGRINQVGKGVGVGPPGRVELNRLHCDRPAPQLGVAAAMVEVEMAVDYQAHVLDADAGFSEDGPEGSAAGHRSSIPAAIPYRLEARPAYTRVTSITSADPIGP